MKEFMAYFQLSESDAKLVDALLDGRDAFQTIASKYARVQLLAQALILNKRTKTYAQVSDYQNNPTGLRKLIQSKEYDQFFANMVESFVRSVGLWIDALPPVAAFPSFSWTLQFSFTLRTHYFV